MRDSIDLFCHEPLVPEFAPYIGVQYARLFGDTADFSRARGEDIGSWSFLVGLRTWF